MIFVTSWIFLYICFRSNSFFILTTTLLNSWSDSNFTTNDDVIELLLKANVDQNIQNTLEVTARVGPIPVEKSLSTSSSPSNFVKLKLKPQPIYFELDLSLSSNPLKGLSLSSSLFFGQLIININFIYKQQHHN